MIKAEQRAKGGKRVGAGRKPSPKTVLARLALSALDEEAEKSVRFMVNVRDNDEIAWSIRVEAAKDIIDRRFGKPRQAIEHSGEATGRFVLVCPTRADSQQETNHA